MGKAIIEGGGTKPVGNGVLSKFFSSGDDVAPNLFVDIESGMKPVSVDTVLSTTSRFAVVVDLHPLSDGRWILFHGGSYTNTAACAKASIIAKDSSGLPYIVSTTNLSDAGCYNIMAVELEKDVFFVAYSYYVSSSDKSAYGVIVDMRTETPSVGTAVECITTNVFTSNEDGLLLVKLTKQKVFLAAGSDYLDSVVCTIDGSTITRGTQLRITPDDYTGRANSGIASSEDKVLLLGSTESNLFMRAYVLDISDTTITLKTDNVVNSISGTRIKHERRVGLGLDPSGKIKIACYVGGSTTSSPLYMLTCSIDESDNLVIEDERKLSDTNVGSGDSKNQLVMMNTGEIVVNDRMLTIGINSGGTMLEDTFSAIGGTSGSDFDVEIRDDSEGLIVRATNGDLRAVFITCKAPVVITPAVDNIYGLSLTKCTEQMQGKVWILREE